MMDNIRLVSRAKSYFSNLDYFAEKMFERPDERVRIIAMYASHRKILEEMGVSERMLKTSDELFLQRVTDTAHLQKYGGGAN